MRSIKTSHRESCLLHAAFGAAVALLCVSCAAKRPEGPLDQALFAALKEDRVDVIATLVPSAEELNTNYFSHLHSSGAALAMFLPVQLVRDYNSFLFFSENPEKDLKRTAATMRETLKREVRAVRKTCTERGFSWKNAVLKKSGFAWYNSFGTDKPFEAGMKDGYLILYVSDGKLDFRVRFRLLGTSNIDGYASVDTLSPEELRQLDALFWWLSGEYDKERRLAQQLYSNRPDMQIAEIFPEVALRALLRHQPRNWELDEWRPAWGSGSNRVKFVYDRAGTEKDRRTVEVHFNADGSISQVFLDGKVIDASIK